MIHVVIGPPCAGKSTYVKACAPDGTLRVDYDAIAQTLGSATAHAATGLIREAAFKARDAVIEHALSNSDEDAWVIHTSPSATQMEKFTTAGATFHLLDPGKEACLERVKTDKRPEATVAAIEAWYANPPAVPTPAKAANVLRLLTQLTATTEEW